MHQFALACVSPRTIAWLIRMNEWERFELIVKYNSAMLGGYFNVIIPLTDQDTIADEYQQFLVDYDPDLVVLAPDMEGIQQVSRATSINPFGFVPWSGISDIAELDAWAGGSFSNPTVHFFKSSTDTSYRGTIVAVSDPSYPDTSRLALVACGDVESRQPMWSVTDDSVHLDAIGYRESFLRSLIKPVFKTSSVATHESDDGEIIDAPDRYGLSSLINEENQFPLLGSTAILETCCTLQHFHPPASFINLTRIYASWSYQSGRKVPGLVILVSETFGLQEAVLFWNLRANSVFVSWLSFTQLESDYDQIATWILSENKGGYYGFGDIALAASDESLSRLHSIANGILDARRRFPQISVIPYGDVLIYDHNRSNIIEEQTVIAEHNETYVFAPKLPQANIGMFAVTLKWDRVMLPPNSTYSRGLVSPATIPYIFSRGVTKDLFRIRFTKDRFLRLQTHNYLPIEFKRPTAEHLIQNIITDAGFLRIQRSSTARYHQAFVQRAGGLTEAAFYLATSPYQLLLEVLADNSNKGKEGWILERPDSRRVLHHLQLRNLLGALTPLDTKRYFDTVSDELPREAVELLEKGLLERGFRLECSACSSNAWYPVEQIGQDYQCARCYQRQVYKSNPLWLYKLPEVIFQGLNADNMHVPLLALNYLQKRSSHTFEWVPDSDVYWQDQQGEKHQNVDLLCLVDGKFYIGEAKSNATIDANQFRFYTELCHRLSVDGVVFATSENQWDRATLNRIEQLRTQFTGEVLVLTRADLYSIAGE